MPKMSERLLKTLQDFSTSKLNTSAVTLQMRCGSRAAKTLQRRWAGSKSTVWNKKPPRRAACWSGDQLELWPLSFGRLLA
jgi:hypothetical protein